MERSRKIQTRIAWVSGLIFAGLLIAMLMQTYDIKVAVSNTTVQTDAGKKDDAAAQKSQMQKATTPEKSAVSSVDTPKVVSEGEKTQEASAPVVSTPKTDTANKDEAPTTNSGVYTYTAAPGDSYTAMVRKAIESYTAEKSISPASYNQLLAEVAVVNAAGQPELEVGQKIEIKKSDIAATLETNKTIAQLTPSTTASVASEDGYTYTANQGDSYTLKARDAVQQYAKSQKLTLSSTQIIAAESMLTTAAGQPDLIVGQQVVIAKSAVKNAVVESQKLGADAIAAWSPYTYDVVFTKL